jgi:hypothetical protein
MSAKNVAVGPFLSFAGRLRFPWLFLLTVVVFLFDLIVPDMIPFVDEVLLGLSALVLGSLRRKKPARPQNDPGAPHTGSPENHGDP